MNSLNNDRSVDVNINKRSIIRKFFSRWEWILFLIFILMNVVNASLSNNYLSLDNLSNVMIIFLDKAIMVYPMMLVLLLGEIDISVSSIIPLACVVGAVTFDWTNSVILTVLIILSVGIFCGFLNGFLLTKFTELNSTMVTLGHQILFRGIAYMLIEDLSLKSFVKNIPFLAWGDFLGIPLILIFFLVETFIFYFLVRRAKFGRRLKAIGTNRTASVFSGINNRRIIIIVYMISGLFAAFSGLFLISKLGSVRANIARGYEMEVIAMAVLGGVSTNGGKGSVIGACLGALTIGLLRYGLGLVNVSAQYMMIIIGFLLIISVAISNRKEISKRT